MQKRICQVGIVIGLMVIGFLSGQVVHIRKDQPTLKLGLPGGGGGIHFCCFHANGGGAWQAGQIATNGAIVTGANMASLCNGGFLPVRQNCN